MVTISSLPWIENNHAVNIAAHILADGSEEIHAAKCPPAFTI
jgi:hypothetical protein